MKTGLGTFACGDGLIEVGAIAAVNACADVYSGAGNIISGLLSPDRTEIMGTVKVLKGMIHPDSEPDLGIETGIHFLEHTRLHRPLFQRIFPHHPSATPFRRVLRDIQMDALEIQKAAGVMKNTVRVERAIKDITQQQLADAIGVSRNTINSIESGKYVPSTVLALKIARYFDKSTDSIFQLDEND